MRKDGLAVDGVDVRHGPGEAEPPLAGPPICRRATAPDHLPIGGSGAPKRPSSLPFGRGSARTAARRIDGVGAMPVLTVDGSRFRAVHVRTAIRGRCPRQATWGVSLDEATRRDGLNGLRSPDRPPLPSAYGTWPAIPYGAVSALASAALLLCAVARWPRSRDRLARPLALAGGLSLMTTASSGSPSAPWGPCGGWPKWRCC